MSFNSIQYKFFEHLLAQLKSGVRIVQILCLAEGWERGNNITVNWAELANDTQNVQDREQLEDCPGKAGED